MKSRHLILFIIACATLIVADLPGGSLLALIAWLQVNTLFTQTSFDKNSQLWAIKLFFASLPFVLFWGSIHSFVFIYGKEENWIFFLMALTLSACLCFAGTIFYLFTFEVADNANFKLIASISQSWITAKEKKISFFKCSSVLFILTLVPVLRADWKIVFAVMATHLFLNRSRLKPVFAAGF